ncbi:MAG TPA: N-acetylmuramoyl-L-alanine amidase [Terriglobales bacterium]|nr:N-acetylmuramoyl-L-alanine amidase [Terriglobales bacterium]
MRWNRSGHPAACFVVLAASLIQTPPPAATPPSQTPGQAPARLPTPVIVIDPAHGGADSGAALNAAIPEKDVTLVFARRLRQELLSRGIQSQLLRDSDSAIATDQRASQVNALQPRLYVAIHATSQGSGLRLYTAILPIGEQDVGPFVEWRTAQAAALARSRAVEEQIAAAIQKAGFPVRKLSAALRPLNSVTAPAIAIEVAPTNGDVSQLASSEYQQMLCAELADAITAAVPSLTRAVPPQ